ncbi:MAG: tRNA (N(6)-L-threonylcarbamoyladenosine(37)-C(2))-methylthiotransferase MtaB [Bacteroidota bacterium]|nr:tRNA (N(6)-L-threonylcarbamoyladenosine(37)-C(2))-methylthiotransferase MtaB [Candidatus Kapabacteria bacterium]MDW8219273.1 tRNA (N(6)-L-threonylcarbamoyladenosine(37)-C(2))-methylthiotransferase MtaB [Bacteroidota bacterium]
MTVALYTLGCKLNYAETSQLQSMFEREGHTVVPFGQPADVVIINTCTVTENADRECRQIIRRALRISPKAFIGVTGCYAQLQPEEIASIDGVDAVFGAQEKFRITELIGDFQKVDTPRCFVSDIGGVIDFAEAQSYEYDSRTRAFLKIQDGCNYKCSFCTIPRARGRSRAIDFQRIPEKIRALEAAGYHEIVLSGINIGDYRAPSGETFTDVIHLIEQMQPRLRIRISSIEPNLLTQEIIETIAQSSVLCPSFHIPLQSGSPEVLRHMRRRYNVEQYRDLIFRIKASMPHAAIGADVIVGFPTETNVHFEETYTFVETLPISYLHVFSYSERDNTPAAEYSVRTGGVPMRQRAERSRQLRLLSAEKKRQFYQSQCGTERIVIPEQRNPKTGLWEGWTENYIRVEFTAPSMLMQAPVRVLLQRTYGDIVQSDFLYTISPYSVGNPSYIPIVL